LLRILAGCSGQAEEAEYIKLVEAIEGDDDKRWLGGTGKGLSLAQRLGANSPDDRLALIIGPVLDGYSEPIAGPGRLFGLAPVFADLRLFGL
jgi:hypothetical protein